MKFPSVFMIEVPDEYRGFSYEQASREAERLINKDGWFQSFERLIVLRKIMEEQASHDRWMRQMDDTPILIAENDAAWRAARGEPNA
jgi:hypothetical protein